MYHTGTTGQDRCDRRPHVKLWVLCILSLSLLLQTGQSHAAQGHLSWKAPTASADSTPLTDLAGYYVYYWRGAQQVPTRVKVGLQRSYILTGLTRGKTYRFAVTAYDKAGNESVFSNAFIVTIPAPIDDSDGDGLTDTEKVTVYGTDPQRADTDGDGLSDGAEVAWWRTEWQADVDGDGLINLLDADGDGDGILDGIEVAQVSNPADATSVPMAETVQLWLEAEEGVLTSPMRVSEDDRASAGQYIWVPKGAEWGGKAAYDFHVPVTGAYVVWGRVISNSRKADSFFVTLDNRESILWNTQHGGTETWVWDQVRQRGGDDPVIFFLEAGAHTLVIERREVGTKIDCLLITNTLDDIP